MTSDKQRGRQTHMILSADHRRRLKAIQALALDRDLTTNTAACEAAIDFYFDHLQRQAGAPGEPGSGTKVCR